MFHCESEVDTAEVAILAVHVVRPSIRVHNNPLEAICEGPGVFELAGDKTPLQLPQFGQPVRVPLTRPQADDAGNVPRMAKQTFSFVM